MGLDANIGNPGVDIPPPLRLRGLDAEWYERTLRYGVRLRRPGSAPAVSRRPAGSFIVIYNYSNISALKGELYSVRLQHKRHGSCTFGPDYVNRQVRST